MTVAGVWFLCSLFLTEVLMGFDTRKVICIIVPNAMFAVLYMKNPLIHNIKPMLRSVLNDKEIESGGSNMQNVREKSQYWQSIRGISILAVVLIHCGTTTNMPFAFGEGTYYLFIRSMYNFAVSTLFFMAGKFTKIENGNCNAYYIKRFKRILIPYLVWSVIYLLFGIIRGIKYSFWKIIVILFTGGAGIPFYYSIVLFYFTLLSPLFAKMMKQKCQGLLYMSIGCTLILTIGGYFVQQFTGNAGWIKLTPIWLGFYVAGMLQGERKLKTRSTQCQAWIIWIVAYIIQVVESYVLLQNVRLADIAYSQLRLGAFLYAAATINLMLAMESQLCVRKSLAYIGDRSYGIYFIHCIFCP